MRKIKQNSVLLLHAKKFSKTIKDVRNWKNEMTDFSLPSLFFYHKKVTVGFAILRTNPFLTHFGVDQNLSSLFSISIMLLVRINQVEIIVFIFEIY